MAEKRQPLAFRPIRRAGVIAILATVVSWPCAAQAGQDTAVTRMQAALARADVAGAERAAQSTLATDTLPAHRRDALMTLANLAWRVRLDTGAAERFLREAETLPARSARAAALIQSARARFAAHDLGGAIADANAAGIAAFTAPYRARALEIAGQALSAAPTDTAEVRRVLAELSAAVSSLPGEAGIALQLVSVASIARDGPALLAGWRSYYLIQTNGESTNVLAAPHDTLERVLPSWNAATDTRATRLTIVRALAASRFFQTASYLARRPLPDGSDFSTSDPGAREIVAYATFCANAQRVTNDFYRHTALHSQSESGWRDSVENAARAAWPQLQWPGEPPRFSLDAFEREAGRRFGLVVQHGSRGGFTDAHIGHTIADETHRVTQWGKSSTFHFIQLDQMLSNGFLSWFSDGQSVEGGWNHGSVVVQVRPAEASIGILAWDALTDSTIRAAVDMSIAADSAADLVRAKTSPVAFFPSVTRRLTRSGQLGLLDSLRGTGLAGDALRERFVRQLSDEMLEYSIFQHEGRHAIDRRFGVVAAHASSWIRSLGHGESLASDLEFTARLAQVEFGPRPALAFAGIMNRSVGDQTGHGSADARVLRGLLEWMTVHKAQIAHLDNSMPLLPQIPLLTGAQLRAAVRSMDPLSPCQGSTCN